MQFRSEWLLEDSIEVVSSFEKNILSKDDIERLSPNESFNDIEKATHLLEKGQMSQKIWVVQSLKHCMFDLGFDRLIAELIVIFN
jgi:hypothetical protein